MWTNALKPGFPVYAKSCSIALLPLTEEAL